MRKMAKTLETTNTSLQLVLSDIAKLEKQPDDASDGENDGWMLPSALTTDRAKWVRSGQKTPSWWGGPRWNMTPAFVICYRPIPAGCRVCLRNEHTYSLRSDRTPSQRLTDNFIIQQLALCAKNTYSTLIFYIVRPCVVMKEICYVMNIHFTRYTPSLRRTRLPG